MADKLYDLAPIDPGGQLRLLPESVTDEMMSKTEAQHGICTGERLRSYDPARYELVCTLLAEGSLSQRQVSRISGISRNLVAGIVKSQASDIEPLKAKIAGQLSAFHQLCVERATEMVLDDDAKVTLRDLVIGAGVSAEKLLLMSGQATNITEFKAPDTEDEFTKAMRKAKRVDAVDVDAVETGIGGESFPAKGSGSAAAGGADRAAAGGVVDGVQEVGK